MAEANRNANSIRMTLDAKDYETLITGGTVTTSVYNAIGAPTVSDLPQNVIQVELKLSDIGFDVMSELLLKVIYGVTDRGKLNGT